MRASFEEVCLQAGLPLIKPLVLVGSLEEDLVHLITDVPDDSLKMFFSKIILVHLHKLQKGFDPPSYENVIELVP